MPSTITATMDAATLAALATLRRKYAEALEVAVLWHNKCEATTSALAAAQADAAQWRQRVMDARPILNLVEDVSDDPSPANVAALVDAFDAWRMCVERGVPSIWGVAESADALPGPDWTE